MSRGRSTAYGEEGAAVARGSVVGAGASAHRKLPCRADAVRREIGALRSINAYLVRQIAALKEREAQALQLADRDGLTGLYNRRKMRAVLDASLYDAVQNRCRVGVLFVDLDGFKKVNDAYGHAMGDKLLVTVASRLASRARLGDVVCRYGGDEFVVILPRATDLVGVRRVADCLAKRVALPCRIDGCELQITAAIGAAIYPDEARSAASLMRLADESMYRAKSSWADPKELLRGVPPHLRRRDDASKRRPGH